MLWLVNPSHVTGNIQTKGFISAQQSYEMLKFIYDIGSSLLSPYSKELYGTLCPSVHVSLTFLPKMTVCTSARSETPVVWKNLN